MTKWEYMIVDVDGDTHVTESSLDRLGNAGWELVAVNMERATFKREVPHMSAAEVEEMEALPGDIAAG